jgi:hypothetical protein
LRRFIAASLVPALILVGFVWAGLLDRLSYDGRVDRILLTEAIVFYWLSLNLFTWFILRWKRWSRQIMLALLTLVLGLILAEVTLRQIMPKQVYRLCRHLHSGRYHHVLPANRTLFQGYYEDPVLVKTNKDGLRTKYTRAEFLAHAPRIAVLGDSFTFGLGVRQDRVWPAILEVELRKALPHNQPAVLNAGMMSYSPILQKTQLQDIVLDYKPDIILLCLDASDIGDDYRYAQEILMNEGGAQRFGEGDLPPAPDFGAVWILTDPIRRKVMRAAAFPYTFISRRLGGSTQRTGREDYDYYDFSLPIGGTIESNRFFIYRYHPDLTKPYFEKTLSHVQEMADTCHSRGIDFVLIPSPRFHHWNTNECPRNWEHKVYSKSEPYQYAYLDFFSGEEVQKRMQVFQILDAFKETTEFPLVFETDPHWNKRGHAFVGRVVAEHLLRTFPDVLRNPEITQADEP